ncbi:hypothetical protein BDA96_02G167100 [Sorghum bicolor]|uniref:Uncharacterized protein n=1 Tax=Sorghum bicolor TaxID=4558 RepID=A0A921RMM3_SORBI|nr:hypothetical protein BDA96_02G167100 [Sorghum bicolor]
MCHKPGPQLFRSTHLPRHTLHVPCYAHNIMSPYRMGRLLCYNSSLTKSGTLRGELFLLT